MKAKTEKEAIEVIRGRVMDERQEEGGQSRFSSSSSRLTCLYRAEDVVREEGGRSEPSLSASSFVPPLHKSFPLSLSPSGHRKGGSLNGK